MITYKATLVGIQVEVTEESYTSKASFLDLDAIPVYDPNDETVISLVASGSGDETACIAPKTDAQSALMSMAHITFCANVDLMPSRRQRE